MNSISGLSCTQVGSGQREAGMGGPPRCSSSQVLVISLALYSLLLLLTYSLLVSSLFDFVKFSSASQSMVAVSSGTPNDMPLKTLQGLPFHELCLCTRSFSQSLEL